MQTNVTAQPESEQKYMNSLKDKVVLVTGGARGLGAAICQSLYEAGAQVIAADIRTELLQETTSKFSDNGHSMRPVELDVSDEEQVQKVLKQIVDEYGRLDVLVNNAGTDKTVSVEELEIDDWDKVISVNLRGPFLLSKFAFPIMKKQGSGHIVNVTSTAAKRAWPNAAAYHASKWGLLGFTHALHTEARQQGIKVTALVVGGMRTPFLLDRFPDIDTDTLQDPKNVADTVRFLLQQPDETVIPEVMVIPMRETSWP